jgi:superoxide dismutase, Fe-Mn family
MLLIAKRAFSSSLRASAQAASLEAVTLPALDYDYGDLEPHMSADILELHHKKHHQTYVNNYNIALDFLEEAEKEGDHVKLLSLQKMLAVCSGF